MKSKIKKLMEKELKNYKIKEITISNKKYPLYLIPELYDEDLNIFEGFLFVETENKNEVSYLKNRYKPPVSGYAPRFAFIFYNEYFLIKDYRKNKHIIKIFKKINKTFLNKLQKALSEPTVENFEKLFDRTDVIEEFYILYKKAKEYLLKNIEEISEEEKEKKEEKKEEFVDNFMMQMLTLWYLQERGFFNKDKNYFITKFKEIAQEKQFNSYYDFLIYLFEKISKYEDKQYIEDPKIGEVVVIGPAVFLNGEHSSVTSIPDKCFYKDGMTDILIKTPPKKVSQDVPLLNLFESRDWTEGNIDEFVLGALYEKLITYMERKKLGTYYTPEEITSYICKNTIEPYLVDRINEKFKKKYETIDQIIENSDKETILYLFEELKEIKILDPAVGSGHFLESAINVLVNIYEKIWDKAKEIGIKKLEIKAADEKGEVKKINLLEVSDEDRFKLLVKFFIILSKNIYGVDLNPSAIKVAKARLFLTLAKHFKVGKDKDIFIRFPNVHFNLREGNSLIGYVELEKKGRKEQLKLAFVVKEEQTKYIVEKIKIVEELKSYLEKAAKSLGLDGDIVKEVEDLNSILSKGKIDWNDFEKVLKTKEKLITILIASLNSSYARPLNDLLREITELFNQKLDEKFAEEHKIELEDLKKIKTFHWIFEFPEVFLERGGFDVVVGNPPYVRQEDINHIVEEIDYKDILSKLYEPFDNTFDFSMFFILRSLQIVKNKGYHSFIVTNKWLRAKYGKKIRKYLRENFKIKKIIDFNGIRVFVGATVDTLVYVIKKEKVTDENLIFYNHPLDINNMEQGRYFVKQSSLSDDVWNFIDETTLEIKKWIEKVGKPLKELDVKIYRGITTGFNEAFIIDEETRKKLIEEDPKSKELIKPVLRGRDIGRYYVEWDRKWIICTFPALKLDIEKYPAIKNYLNSFGDRLLQDGKPGHRKRTSNKWFETQDQIAYYPEFEKPKIVWQEIVREPSFYLDFSKLYSEATSFIMTLEEENTYINLIKLILLLLNSKISWIAIKLYGTNLGEDTARYKKVYIEKIPIRLSDNSKFFEILTDYLLFLNATKERRQKLKDIIQFFDRQIADSLVYELYFKEKFHEDRLYPEPKNYLLEFISKHLKPINYDRWAELYWKKQLEGRLTANEENELEKLEKENMKVIRQVYDSIKSDPEIQKWIEKIKTYKWVKVIEGKT